MFHVLIYETDIVPVIFCGCKIWSLTSREELRVGVFESGVVVRIFDVRARKEQRDGQDSVGSFMTYSSPNIINVIIARKIIHMCHVACLW
jgi:hypothetical protein